MSDHLPECPATSGVRDDGTRWEKQAHLCICDRLAVCCALCGRPIPDQYLADAPVLDGWHVHPGCLRKAQGRAAR